MVRLISAKASEILSMNKEELKNSIKASEGRVICSENMIIYKPLCDVLTNAEVDKAFGADLILLNFFDVTKPYIAGLKDGDDSHPDFTPDPESIKKLKSYVGRPIGLNLEPINVNATMLDNRHEIVEGRTISKENIEKANDLGFDFVCITGNPKTGVDSASILEAVKLAKKHFKGLIMAGKMHSAGVNEEVVDINKIGDYIEAGADIVLAPAVGTIQGFTDENMIKVVKKAHEHNALVMSTIGTSQEGASPTTIEQIAIRNKICGVDIQHIGDVSQKENIFSMSMAIRGQRHTYNRMAQSIHR
ncbi:MAG: haloacid dehalogenase-like hydrolase [Anaerorhabdus sp.]